MDVSAPAPRHVLFYDGVCRYCNSLVQLALKRDSRGLWRFAPLQGQFAREALAPYGVDTSDFDRIHAIADYGTPRARLVSGADAGILLWGSLSGATRLLAALLRITPRTLREWGYQLIASRRYRIWGRYDECKVPTAEQAGRFLM